MATFFVSDTHFGHDNILRLGKGRPFGSIAEHDEAIIARWNVAVGPNDDVWHLGDFAHRADERYAAACFARLNGRKHLVPGNHDHSVTLNLPWASVQPYAEISVLTDRKYKLVLFHYPIQEWAGFWGTGRGATYHLHGHVHGAGQFGWRRRCDVAVDVWDYTPQTFEAIKARCDTYPDINAQTLEPFAEDRS